MGSNSPWKMRWCFEGTSSLIRTLQTFQTCLSEKAKGWIDHQSLEQVNKDNLENFNWNFKFTTLPRFPMHCFTSKYHKPPKGRGAKDKITHWIVYVFFSERLLFYPRCHIIIVEVEVRLDFASTLTSQVLHFIQMSPLVNCLLLVPDKTPSKRRTPAGTPYYFQSFLFHCICICAEVRFVATGGRVEKICQLCTFFQRTTHFLSHFA